jgi:branched-chain amino acid transport system substrate-binding protein
MRRKSFATIFVAAALVIAACGSDAKTVSTSAAPAATTAATTATTAATTAETTAATAAAPGTTAASTGTTAASTDPIVIGAAIDLTGNMAPFDAPALASAKIAVANINAKGGVLGRQLELKFIDDKLDPAATKAAAVDLITKDHADVLLTTCDVDFATPAIQEGINAGLLTVAPCIGTDQMGPSRFGDAGKLAFSMGNLAQDEGAVLAEYAIEQGYKTAIVVPDGLLVYFQNVCAAFTKRFEEKGGKVISNEGFTSFDQSVNNVPTIVTGAGAADVIAMCTFPPDITTAVKGIRDAGVQTPIFSPWSGDGSFWIPDGLSNFTFSTFASVFGDDPNPEVNLMIKQMTDAGSAPGTGGFVTGAATIEAIAAAIEKAGSTDGAALAAEFEKFSGLDTLSGKISFSPKLHTVFGREYRIMTFTDGKAKFQKLMAASSPADIS